MTAAPLAAKLKSLIIELARYTWASALSLAVDYGTYWILAERGVLSLPIASVVGYCTGLVVAYVLLIRTVYRNTWLSKRRRMESFLFVLSGLFGCIVTYFTVYYCVHALGLGLHLSKMTSVVVSFFSVYVFRRLIVFRMSTQKV